MKNHLNENKLKEILNSKEFEYREGAWDKFATIQQEAVKPRDKRPYLIALLFLIGIAILGLWFSQSGTSPIEDTHVTDRLQNVSGTKDELTSETNDAWTNTDLNPIADDSIAPYTDPKTQNLKVANVKNNLAVAKDPITAVSITQKSIPSNRLVDHSTQTSVNFSYPSLSTVFIKDESRPEVRSNPSLGNSLQTTLSNNGLVVSKTNSSETPSIKKYSGLNVLASININGISYSRKNIWTHNMPRVKSTQSKVDYTRSLQCFGASMFGIGNKKNVQTTTMLGLEIGLSNKIRVESGLGYIWNNVNQLESHRGFSTKYNSFTGGFYHNSIEADKMNLVHIPLMINYHLSNKISTSIGGYYNYLFLTKGTIIGNKDGELTERSTWIVEDGINRNQVGLALKLRIALNDHIQLEGGYNKNLSQSFSVTNGENVRLSNATLGLKYYLKR